MKEIQELRQLLVVCESQYNSCQQKFSELVARENNLRSELARLDQIGRDTQLCDLEQIHLQTLGADVIWQSWLGRSKRNLNIDLAKVLAKKLHYQGEVRLAYGKVQSAQKLVEYAQARVRKKKNSLELDRAIQMTMRYQS